jgi:hypothetical protein
MPKDPQKRIISEILENAKLKHRSGLLLSSTEKMVLSEWLALQKQKLSELNRKKDRQLLSTAEWLEISDLTAKISDYGGSFGGTGV